MSLEDEVRQQEAGRAQQRKAELRDDGLWLPIAARIRTAYDEFVFRAVEHDLPYTRLPLCKLKGLGFVPCRGSAVGWQLTKPHFRENSSEYGTFRAPGIGGHNMLMRSDCSVNPIGVANGGGHWESRRPNHAIRDVTSLDFYIAEVVRDYVKYGSAPDVAYEFHVQVLARDWIRLTA